MKKKICVGMVLLAVGLVLAGCGGKSVEQLAKESLELAAQMAKLNPNDTMQLVKLSAKATKLAADLVKAQEREAAKPAAKASGKAAAAKEAEASDFIYELNKAGDGVIISGIQNDAKFGKDRLIPAEIEGYPVVEYNARHDYSGLAAVVFPESITKIGGRFQFCNELTSITLPKNLGNVLDLLL
jgi:Tfp pilus assembly major pilin PilA